MIAPRPIFVLGLQRSGTTLIGNLLAAHPDVAAATDPHHRGIHESVFFSHFARAWDWRDPAARARAVAAFLDSDYGRLLDLTAEDCHRLERIGDPEVFFRQAMSAHARQQGALAWVEKSPHHVHEAARIAAAYPDARFVAIHRDSAGLVRSRLWAYGRVPRAGLARLPAVLRGALSNAYHRRVLRRFAHHFPDRVVTLEYRAFVAGGAASVAAMIAALGLPSAPGLAPEYAPNSSFAGPDAAASLTRIDHAAIALAGVLCALVPLWLLDRLRAGASSRRRLEFPRWVWSGLVPPPASHSGPSLAVPLGADTMTHMQENPSPCRD
ncbi:sulfotransferase [Ruegeria pomeroyi]|uniref:Twin-arginine translocation pathway signal sequence domain protein, putative n=2 Tax=Ruegeria pomeroyi TaxID=89184 RepID=Q5LT77_RUEPO|nr:sulfotransferase [Ruegeria pomeroyi]AAV94824.1 twin-arginine translocation pathway signal sequence domain protein, putative [Ruegeria pomeroyi DSS-3]NVK95955.1 sulfotransferase [Ruegeria pomeroyi]NVL00066.1 sulfotransferase [Ruegeria pomeroyi]QWV08397.1 sulfotransferase [Ruegeria pomeroyi]